MFPYGSDRWCVKPLHHTAISVLVPTMFFLSRIFCKHMAKAFLMVEFLTGIQFVMQARCLTTSPTRYMSSASFGALLYAILSCAFVHVTADTFLQHSLIARCVCWQVTLNGVNLCVYRLKVTTLPQQLPKIYRVKTPSVPGQHETLTPHRSITLGPSCFISLHQTPSKNLAVR